MTFLTAAACALALPKTFSVGRPATTSVKWPANRDRLSHFSLVSRCVYQPTRAMNSGINGSVKTTMSALVRSAVNR